MIIALLIGLGATYFALYEGGIYGTYHWGAWQARPEVGATNPDPYTRAYLARNEALQMGRGEGIQFIAAFDDDGDKLELSCSYTLAGNTPVAAFWSLRATDIRGTNLASQHAPASLNSKRIARSNDGQIQIHIGKIPKPGNWLELEGAGDFQLIMTFYDASIFAGLGSSAIELPKVTKAGCP